MKYNDVIVHIFNVLDKHKSYFNELNDESVYSINDIVNALENERFKIEVDNYLDEFEIGLNASFEEVANKLYFKVSSKETERAYTLFNRLGCLSLLVD